MSIGPLDMQPLLQKATHTEQVHPSQQHNAHQTQIGHKVDQEVRENTSIILQTEENKETKVLTDEEKRLNATRKRKKKNKQPSENTDNEDVEDDEEDDPDELKDENKGTLLDFNA